MPALSGEKVRIILADDHAILRSGIRRLVEETGSMCIVGEAADGYALVDLLSRELCDLVVMDLGMPHLDGIEALGKIRIMHPELPILVLSMHKEPEFVKRALAHKIQGYLLKDEAFENLITAIRSIRQGKKVFSKSLHALPLWGGNVIHESPISLTLLTPRERQVLGLLARGHTNQIIADELRIRPRTVEAYRANIMAKLEFENFNDLVRYAMEKGLV